MLKNISLAFLAFILLATGGTRAAAPVPPPAIYHHGLPEDRAPHNGWAAYGHLTLDLGGDRYYVYDQRPGEFSATVIDRATETIKIRAISIAGAGLFYFPAEASPCEPDAIERMGLYAELLLFYLSSAFPSGPATVAGEASAVVERPVPELHFMQGLMKPREGARTVVTASRETGDRIRYKLRDDRDTIEGAWEPPAPRPLIPDHEPLLHWHTCWAGTWSKRSDGAPAFASRLPGVKQMSSFGDVRRAVAESAKGKQK
ncbi:MAG: hypothetical protein JO035_08460 [Betaproteobacteria bacterium]|nr:hypothetical protein [Betaproteobacteria bacterium]